MRFFLLSIFSTVLLFVIPACSSDEPEGLKVSNETRLAIKRVFPTYRVDSILGASYRMKYSGDLLTSCKYGGTMFSLKYTEDTVFVEAESYRLHNYKAVIGKNGYVSQLICNNGTVNNYEYDAEYHLTRYDFNLVSSLYPAYFLLTWENGNVVKVRRHSTYDDWSHAETYTDYFFDYGEHENIAGILPPMNSYTWINDSGLSEGYGINNVLYYAGLLGLGSENLVVASRNLHESGQHNQSYSIGYDYDEAGLVVAAKIGDRRNEYYYTKH